MLDLSSVGGSNSSSLVGVTASVADGVIDGSGMAGVGMAGVGMAGVGMAGVGMVPGIKLDGDAVSDFKSEDGAPRLPLDRGIPSAGAGPSGFNDGLGCFGMMTSGASRLPSSST